MLSGEYGMDNLSLSFHLSHLTFWTLTEKEVIISCNFSQITWIFVDVHHPMSPAITTRLVFDHRIDAEAVPDLRMSNIK